MKLTLLSWPDYIDPQTVEQFTREYGIAVQIETVPSAVELVDRMRAPGPPLDVLCPPDYAVRELQSENRLHLLDHNKLPNLKHLEARFKNGRAHDPEGRVSVVKDWGTTGFMYRTDQIIEQPRSWADFWLLAQKYSRHVSVLDSPGEVIGAALKMRGRSYNATSSEEMEQAREDLLKLKPHLAAFDTNYRPLITSGKVWLALGWNGDAAALQKEGVPVEYVIPAEGSQIWEDDWCIADGAANLDAAYTFLNVVLRPEIAVQEARYTGYATGNQSAFKLLDKSTQTNPSIYPPDEVLSKLEPGLPLGADGDARRAALWQEIRG